MQIKKIFFLVLVSFSGVLNAQTIQKNSIAVLPVPYVNSENLESSEEMAKIAQNDVYNQLNQKASNITLEIQDLRDTNSLLTKAGINFKNIDETSIAELQKILSVEYIVAAKITYTVTEKQNSRKSTSTTSKDDNRHSESKTNSNTVSSSQVQLVYDYTVYFDIYQNDKKVYSQTRKPFLNNKDSWIDSVSYLLKRSPIYKK